MSLTSIRPTLVTLHRWFGLVLTPIFLVVILSGAVLSFRPITADLAGRAPPSTIDVAATRDLIDRLAARAPITALAVADGGRSVDVTAADPTVAGRWDVASGARGVAVAAGPDVFAVAESLHKQLLVGLGLLVEAAAWVMVGLVVVGPFLTWLRFRNSVVGWHMAIGWCLFPLVLAAPLTGVLMTLHVGDGGTPLPRSARPIGVAEAMTIAARDVDLTGLVMARPFRGGTVMMRLEGAAPKTLVVTDTAAVTLTGGPSWVKRLHEGTWGGIWSGLLNFVASIALFGSTVTGAWSWIARRRRDRPTTAIGAADVLVAHASQTGTAARIAEATARALAAGGESVALAPLGTVAPRDLARFRLVLLVAATTGDGDVPDGARRFLQALTPGGLDGVRFAVLALGDRSYATFCGGAERLRTAMTAAGAIEVLAPARADRDPTPTWSAWLNDLDLRLGLKPVAAGAPIAAARVELCLAARRRLDDPTHGDTQETWAVTLTADSPLDFRPGDLVRIAPEEDAAERSYSIGSSARIDPRRIELTVKRHRRSDGGVGRMSERLVASLPLGSRLTARITAHPSFNPPDDPSRPIVMIASGTGVAPFPGFLAERRASGRAGPAWLIFGNRHAAGDFLWRDVVEAASADGTLSRLDTAFSRDPGDGARVQTRLREAAPDLCRWLLRDDAIVYVCGRRAMVDGVCAALAEALAAHGGFTPEAATAEVVRRIAHDLVRVDAFD